MTETWNRKKLFRETLFLSICSVGLQGLGLLLNIFLTRKLGAASVGELTLIGSFYGLAAVLSGGGGFTAASRFLSEEMGCGGDPHRVYQYIVRFCLALSIFAAAILCIFADLPARLLHQTVPDANTVRFLSISLPAAALLACLKGRCYAYQRVYLPAVSECIEFFVRACTLAFCTVFLIPQGRMTLLTAFAAAALLGQGSAVLFLAVIRMPRRAHCAVCSFTFRGFIRKVMPIIGNASLVAILSSTNDALVPLTLLQFGNSAEEALAQFGAFEAIIIPTLFFPSVIQCCMSGLIVPVLSRANAENDRSQIRVLTERVLEQTIAYALFIVLILMHSGMEIGTLLGGDAFTGKVLRQMAPVVPLIYLEIIMEGILRGLGKHNFSTVNYLAEYLVRISVLLICVPLFGFYGIAASYMACNLTGNAVRLYFVLRQTELKPVWRRIIIRPVFALVISWQVCTLGQHFLSRFHLYLPAETVIYLVCCGGMYYGLLRLLNRRADSAGNTGLSAANGTKQKPQTAV